MKKPTVDDFIALIMLRIEELQAQLEVANRLKNSRSIRNIQSAIADNRKILNIVRRIHNAEAENILPETEYLC